jgi:hypothetical protein
MFSSNQVLRISGSFSQLEHALQFALDYSGNTKNMTKAERDRGCKLLFQITEDGKYCIGWGFGGVPEGWNEYQFDFETPIVSQIIVQHIKKQPRPESEYDWSDGGTSDGFLMSSIRDCSLDERKGIKSPFFCIVVFEPFCCFYAK